MMTILLKGYDFPGRTHTYPPTCFTDLLVLLLFGTHTQLKKLSSALNEKGPRNSQRNTTG